MEISYLPTHLPKLQLQQKAKAVSGRLTAPTSWGIPILCSYSRKRNDMLPNSGMRTFKSCRSTKDLTRNLCTEYDFKGSTSFDFEKFRPLRYSSKNTELLATNREPHVAQVKEEENANESLKRFGSTQAATDGAVKVEQVLHMVRGTGENSYAKNSRIQAKGILKAKPIVEEAVKEVFKTLIPKKFVAVDLACSSGSNTFLVISEITNVVDGLSRQSGLINSSEIQIFLNDLPGNDFNNIFRSLIAYEKQVKEEKGENFVPFYVAGSPGSFYRRLFPSKSVHFFHSSYGQMWLSKVPKGVDDKNGQLKMENLYLEQFKEDFSTFLKLRSEELVSGGRMVLTISGRRNNPKYKDMAYIWGLLTVALNDMISEGLLKEEDQNVTSFPFYTPSMEEVKSIIEKEGSFYLDQMQTFELSWDPFEDGTNNLESEDYILRGEIVMKYIRAAAEPILDRHFEKEIINDLFSRYAKIIATHLNEKPKWVSFILDLKLRG